MAGTNAIAIASYFSYILRMSEMGTSLENTKDLTVYRRLLVLAGVIYLLWWFAVDSLLPLAFNPFLGRVLVVLVVFTVFGLSYLNVGVRKHIRILSILCIWLITLHYYYLFYGNGGDSNWIVGCYITVMAVNFCLLSNAALLSYSLFVLLLSIGLVIFVPTLRLSVFLPGLVTIVVQANFGLRARLSVIKNLAESNERFQFLFNSTFEGVLVHRRGLIVSVNDAAAKMTGHSKEELIGRNILDIVHPDERVIAREKMLQEDVAPYELRGITKDGQTLPLEVRAKAFTYDKDQARLVTVQDIGDRKRAEKEKVEALTLAENVRVRDEFISIASHELKTPISSLTLQIQMIERELSRGGGHYSTEQLAEFVALFNRQIHRLTELVETMLDVSRISAGRLTLDFQRTDLANLVREVVTHLRARYQPSEIRMDVPEHLWLEADHGRLVQVVENLVTNAIKYGQGRPIQVCVLMQDDQALLVVEDHGLGIAPEFVERIFDRFERAISARNISGLGLGLYIARQIVEAHHGRVTVKSELGQGSVFTVNLPLRKEKT
jgi:PAS domain S-box-containing protein